MEKDPNTHSARPLGVHPYYTFVSQERISEIIQKFIEHLSKAQDPEFPIQDFGLSCYMQAMSDVFEALSALDYRPEDFSGKDPLKVQNANVFKAMKEAWLQAKFQMPGAVN